MTFQKISDFPSGKSVQNGKTFERQVLDFLRQSTEYPPLTIRLLDKRPSHLSDVGPVALLEARWNDRIETFLLEVKAKSQPAFIANAITQLKGLEAVSGIPAILTVPYLSPRAMDQLAENGLSGLDLSGNCVIQGRTLSVWRAGYPNRFRESRPIQNPYRGDSSIFARCFLLRPSFASLSDLHEFALSKAWSREEDSSLRLSTASKVVQALVDEQILAKGAGAINLIDRRRLLRNLETRYRRPESRTIVGKSDLPLDEIWSRLTSLSKKSKCRNIATGLSSAEHYGILFGDHRLTLYVDDLELVARELEVAPGRAFANIELIEETKGLVYFDAATSGDQKWASKIQTWIELAQGSAREQEAAETLESEWTR